MKHCAFKARAASKPRPMCAAFAALFAAFFASCALFSDGGNADEVVVMTYNTQTFFDSVTSGTEFAEFKKKDWTEDLYTARLERLAQVLSEAAAPPREPMHPLVEALYSAMPKKGSPPSIAVLQEIENEDVLRDVVSFLPNQDFYSHLAFIPAGAKGAFSTGILSVFPIESVKVHALAGERIATDDAGADVAIPAPSLASLRPLAEVSFATDKGRLALFAVHWKSKGGSGNAEENRQIRLLQEELLAERIRLLEQNEPTTPFIVCGDFNQPPDDFALMQKYPCAWDFLPQEAGTYFWRGEREKIDNIIVSPLFKESIEAGRSAFFVAEHDFLFGSDGEPHAFRIYTGKGYSDHLPLVFAFRL